MASKTLVDVDGIATSRFLTIFEHLEQVVLCTVSCLAAFKSAVNNLIIDNKLFLERQFSGIHNISSFVEDKTMGATDFFCAILK